MLECNLSGHRLLSLSEVYHKEPPRKGRLSSDIVVLDEDSYVVEHTVDGHGPVAG